jgi:hypothetical protein
MNLTETTIDDAAAVEPNPQLESALSRWHPLLYKARRLKTGALVGLLKDGYYLFFGNDACDVQKICDATIIIYDCGGQRIAVSGFKDWKWNRNTAQLLRATGKRVVLLDPADDGQLLACEYALN